jgi:hypothetical protein
MIFIPIASDFEMGARPVDVFAARCKARAALVVAGEMDFHQAIDGLQAAAVETGLVAAIGQDAVQAIMVASGWDAPSWREAAAWYHEQRGDRVLIVEPASFKRAAGAAPKPTVDALMYSLRERGVAALAEPATRRRLGELSEEQLREVGGRVQQFKPHIARSWTADEVAQLVETWGACHA